MKWLITGGCGFIGLNLIEHLLSEADHSIRIVDNLSVGSREELLTVCKPDDPVELVVADVLEKDVLLKASEEVDVIVHLAANTGVSSSVKNPRYDCTVNVEGTLNCLEAARHNAVKRFVFASSGAPLGESTPPINEESIPKPVSPYGASKLAGEGYCSAYFHAFGIETVALRFSNVYGQRSQQKNSVVAKFIKQIINEQQIEVYGDGFQTRDFIFVGDIVRAIFLSANSMNIGGELFQIATNTETSIQTLIEVLRKVLIDYGISDFEVKYTDNRIGDIKRNCSDISKAKKLLNWGSEVDLENGLRRTVSWFLSSQF